MVILGCKATQVAWLASPTPPPTATATATSTVTASPIPASSTPIPPTATSTPIPTATPLPSATATPIPSLTPLVVIDPLATTRQLATFEELWSIVKENYLYRDFNGLDWDAVYQEFRQQIEAGLSDSGYYHTMNEMISRLGDDHSSYLSPKDALEDDQMRQGEVDYVGIGVRGYVIPEKSSLTVLLVYPGSPAEQGGIKIPLNGDIVSE